MSLIYTDKKTGAKLYQCGASEIPHYLGKEDVDLLVLAAREFQPKINKNIKKVYVPFNDTTQMSEKELADMLDKAMLASNAVAHALAAGCNALVTCWAGLNRSGLISGMALIDYANMGGKQAIRQIQRKRRGALFNPKFRKILLAYAD